MNEWKKSLGEKKSRMQEKIPRYSLRKLSIGVVSCVLGYFLFCAPTAVKAAEISPDTKTVIETSADELEGIDHKEVLDAAGSSPDQTVSAQASPGEVKDEINSDTEKNVTQADIQNTHAVTTDSAAADSAAADSAAADGTAADSTAADSAAADGAAADSAAAETKPEALTDIHEDNRADQLDSTHAKATSESLASENTTALNAESNVAKPRAARSLPNTVKNIEVREANVSENASNAVHGVVGVQIVGDVNLDTSNPNNQDYYIPVPGVDVFFQWFEEVTGDASPIYKATSGADGKFHIGIAPYLTQTGRLVKFDADTTVSAGRERYRFWVDTATIPDAYQLAWTTGEGVVFPDADLPYTAGGASNSTPKNQLNGFKVLLKEKTSELMHRDTPTQTPPKVTNAGNGGNIEGKVAWDWESHVGGVQYATIQDATIPAKGVTVVASYLSDYAMKQIYSPETARDLGVASAKEIRGSNWTVNNERDLQNWIKRKIREEGKELWIAETVEATTNGEGNYIIQFNGTWGPKSNRDVADYTRKAGEYNGWDAHTWTDEEVKRLGTVAANAQDGSFADGALDWTEKHINYNFLFISLKDTDDLAVLTPYNFNQFAAHNDAWGIHNGWGTGTFKSVVYPLNKSLNAGFTLRSSTIHFEIVDYNSTTNVASPGTRVETKTTGLPYKNSAETQYRVAWFDDTGKEITTSGRVEKAAANGSISSNPHISDPDLLEAKTYTAKLIQVNPNGTDGNVIAVDTYTVVPNSPVGSVMENYSWIAIDEMENTTYSVSGLPEGLSYRDGVVSGRPAVGQAGVYDVVFEARIDDEAGEVKSSIHRFLMVTDVPLAKGEVGSEYNQEVKLSGLPADGSYKYEILKVELDPTLAGLQVVKEGDVYKITGTPEAPNTANQDLTNVKVTSNIYKYVGSGWSLIAESHVDNVPLNVTKVFGVDISNPNQTVLDEKPIQDIVITPEDTKAKVTVDQTKLPGGVTYDESTKTISGTPDVTDWNGVDDEERDFTVPVKVENEDGSVVNKTVSIKVQRDTDKDGIPDVTDPDDDGDGATDQEEKEKGTDPKDPNSRPAAPIVNVPGVDKTVKPSPSNSTKPVANHAKPPVSPKKVNNGGKLPRTGEVSQTGLFGLLTSASAGLLLLLGKRRKKEEE